MRLGLLGYPINHSLSPKLYEKFLGEKLTSYKLFSFSQASEIPTLRAFAAELDGLNITSPYKTHFINEVKIISPIVRQIGAVNTLAFAGDEVWATNTDVVAVEQILQNFQLHYGKLKLVILGDGVMAQVTKLVAEDMALPYLQYSRKSTDDLTHLDLSQIPASGAQVIIINACSRSFVFEGKLQGNEIFWDYNYNFPPHQSTLPSQVKAYFDGQEMLELQAKAAIEFWYKVIPKLK